MSSTRSGAEAAKRNSQPDDESGKKKPRTDHSESASPFHPRLTRQSEEKLRSGFTVVRPGGRKTSSQDRGKKIDKAERERDDSGERYPSPNDHLLNQTTSSVGTPRFDPRQRKANKQRWGLKAPPLGVKTRAKLAAEIADAQAAREKAEADRVAKDLGKGSSAWKPGRRALDDLLDPAPLAPEQIEERKFHPSIGILPRGIFGNASLWTAAFGTASGHPPTG
jgi:hypothetical protein